MSEKPEALREKTDAPSLLDQIRVSMEDYASRRALVYKEKQYTYKELEQITGRLASRLKAAGAGRGKTVSILVPRSEYITIAPLGVLRSGAAYQPLDSSHPAERINLMIEDAHASHVIVSKDLEHLLNPDIFSDGRKKLYIEDIEDIAAPAVDAVPVWEEEGGEDTFVILYTSGSTGRPKGTELLRKNVNSLLEWYKSYYEVDRNCRMAQHASFVFDLAIVESLLPLASGAAVYIIPEEIRRDILLLNRFFEENRITHTSMTTQLGRQFARNIRNTSLRHLTVGGEALMSVDPPEGYMLHNGYGPTECTVFVTMFPVLKHYQGVVPLGRPLPEVAIYILNDKGEQVGQGRTGELCIAGPHVGRGYLNNRELTDKVYTVNPFSKDPDYDRLYHTGDLARKGEDGNIEYMGRADRQVKIRGFRVEPAEIEALLKEFKDIKDAAVSAPLLSGGRILAAYYLSEEPLDEGLLKEYILKEKPSYMLPSFFIHLDRFPLNTNGKVDYDKLPLPVPKEEGIYEAPADSVEKGLAALYEEILGIPQAGRGTDFLRLGGNSLLAAILLYRIYQTFSCHISIRDIMEYPTIAGLASRIKSLTDGREETGSRELLIPEKLPIRDEYLVSAAQERVYTAQAMLPPDDDTYLLQLKVRTEGEFLREKTREVLMALFERHESLRTGFYMTDGGLVQKISGPGESLRMVEKSERKTLSDKSPVTFLLNEPPLFAWHFEKKELTFFWHHIISDGKSNLLFAREFAALYTGQCVPSAAFHQKEFAALEKTELYGIRRAEKRKKWKDLSNEFRDTGETELPSDGVWEPSFPREAGHVVRVLSGDLSEKIMAFCRKEGCTPYMLLLAVFSLVISRYSRQDEIILGTVMDGRTIPGSEDLQGMFVNTVPLFLKVSEKETWDTFLKKIKDRVLFALENQDVPLEDIAGDFSEMGAFARTKHGHLLFNVLFVMQSLDRKLPDMTGEETHLVFEPAKKAMYDLTLETEIRDGCFCFDFEYDRKLFLRSSMETMADHLLTLLENCLQAGEEELSALSMINSEENRKLLHDFAGKDLPDTGNTVISLLAKNVETQPDKTAVVIGEQELTYRELWERSGSLAGKLGRLIKADRGSREEERRVAVIAKRSLSMVVSLWAVLKSGCAYVPILPSYPGDRISYLLSDSRPSAVILAETDIPDEVMEKIHEAGLPLITVKDSRQTIPEKTGGECRKFSPDRPAYLIYTSGTTGRPKGVVVEHRQLANMLDGYNDIYRLGKEDTVLAFAEFVFDQSVWDMFHILTVGGTLCLIPEEIVRDPEALTDYCEEKKVTAVSLTPAYLRLLDPERFHSLKLLDVGGEAPDRSLLLKWCGARRVFNTYGPTETTVNATSYLFSGDKGLKENVPIGRPVPGTRIYIMNGDRLSGLGVPGELCIAGRQVTRGYFNRPGLTAEKYVRDPFSEGRMYRSGDLARLMADGNVEFMGRLDDQVKFLGYRIETGEIEAAIRSLEGIADAAVVIKKDAGGEKRLCAYYVSKEHTGSTSEKYIRQSLKDILPAYMVPGFFVRLDKLPLTVNGKLDKRALPDPVIREESGYLAPRTVLEKEMEQVFCTILGTDRCSIDADFLEMGGDSIKAIAVVSALRKRGYRLEAATVLKEGSIERLSRKMGQGREESFQEYSRVKPVPVMRQYYRSDFYNPSWYNQSAVLRLPDGQVNPGALETALYSLTLCHGMLRLIQTKSFDEMAGEVNGTTGQIHEMAGKAEDGGLCIRRPEEMNPVDLPVYRDLPENERRSLFGSLQARMDPIKGEVMKAALFINGQTARLYLAFHHLVIDQVSWGILCDDLNTLYHAAVTCPEKDGIHAARQALIGNRTVSFGEWSEKLWLYASSDAFRREREWWQDQHLIYEKEKKGMEAFLKGYRTKEDAGPGYGHIRRTLSSGISGRLLSISKKRYHTGLHVILLAAFCRAVREEKKNRDPFPVTLFLESHGRGNLMVPCDNSRTVGWFTSVFPVLIREASGQEEQIVFVKETLAGIPNFGIGYGLLYEAPVGRGAVLFNYLGEEQPVRTDQISLTAEEAGPEADPLNGEKGTVSLDMRMTPAGLMIHCLYDKVYEREKLDRLLDVFCGKLEELAETDRAEERIYTPSDFCHGKLMDLHDWAVAKRMIQPERIQSCLGLTPMQQGMLYHYFMEPESRAYYYQDRLILYGPWKPACFAAALGLLSMRYDALRLRFISAGLKEPWQVVLKDDTDLFKETGEGLLKAARINSGPGKARCSNNESGDTDVCFSLSRETPFHVMVGARDKNRTELLISSHHIIIDGWSFPILIEKLMDYYRRLSEGEEEKTLRKDVKREAKESCSFADYLRTYEDYDKRRGLSYWKSYLEGIEEGCGLSALYREQDKPAKMTSLSFQFEKNTEERIKEFTVRHHLTESCFFAALWGILLGFENGGRDVVFGETVSGRNVDLAGIDEAVGMFVNTLPVRIRWDEDTDLAALFEKKQEENLGRIPFERSALSEIGAAAGFSAGNLVRTIFAFENYPKKQRINDYSFLPGREEIDQEAAFIVDKGDGFSFTLLYNSALYPDDYMELVAKRLENLALQITAGQAGKVCDLERITEEEKALMLGEICGTGKDFPAESFLDMLKKQVRTDPEKTALFMEGRTVSYGQLWRACLRLSARIPGRGERFLVIMADRSIEMILAMIAAFMAGAAYVPLDPAYPKERIAFILQDLRPCGAFYLRQQNPASSSSTEEEIKGLFAKEGIPLISRSLDTILKESGDDEKPGFDRKMSSDPNRIAYMIYTSGTTGRPKAVMIEHRALADMIHVHEEFFGSLKDDVVMLMSNIVFDASVQQIFPALAQGGRVAVMPARFMGSPKDMAAYFRRAGATFFGATNALLKNLSPSDFGSFRVISIGGDAAEPALFKAWAPHTELLVNDYGPTEVTVHAAAERFMGEEEKTVPIGRPYLNKRIYILQDGRLCGPGQKGEICIGGEGLARGYYHRKELTEKAFVKNPFDGGIMYRTGDLGIFRPDGKLVYEGRRDSQIKIRGYRIEVGEIEEHIKEIKGVYDAVVMSRKKKGRDAFLAAYITCREDLAPEKIKEHLEKSLPAYMVPSYIMRIESFPLNLSGKKDLARLPDPLQDHRAVSDKAEDYFEERIINLFNSILGIEGTGRRDSFFELGGNSLDLMRLMAGLSDFRLKASDVLTHPTPAALGRLLKDDFRRKERGSCCHLLKEGASDVPAIFCIPPSGGMSMCYLELLGLLEYTGPVYGFTDERYRLFDQMTMEEMAFFDPEERDLWPDTLKAYRKELDRLFKPGDILMGYSQGGNAAYILAGLLESRGKDPGALILLESVPLHKTLCEDIRRENLMDRLHEAEEIFFGRKTGFLTEGKRPGENMTVREYLALCLKAHGEEGEGALLKVFYETYLVYSSACAFPLFSEGKVKAPVYSALLGSTGGTAEGETAFIKGNEEDHFVFLSKYKVELVKLIQKWIDNTLRGE